MKVLKNIVLLKCQDPFYGMYHLHACIVSTLWYFVTGRTLSMRGGDASHLRLSSHSSLIKLAHQNKVTHAFRFNCLRILLHLKNFIRDHTWSLQASYDALSPDDPGQRHSFTSQQKAADARTINFQGPKPHANTWIDCSWFMCYILVVCLLWLFLWCVLMTLIKIYQAINSWTGDHVYRNIVYRICILYIFHCLFMHVRVDMWRSLLYAF